MKVFNSLEEIKNIEPTRVALGNFDGVHLGHQKIISGAVEDAKKDGSCSSVFTFSTHPRNAIGNDAGVRFITDLGEKLKLFEDLGVDYVFSIPFDKHIRTMSPQEYIDNLLVKTFNAKAVYCGFNYRFGFKASGNEHMLKEYGKEIGLGVHVMDPILVEGEIVSSTLIRDCIEKGTVDKAAVYLGRPFKLHGTVQEGKKIGRGIGFPTVNIGVDHAMEAPPNGVYVTRCVHNGASYPSITNIGVKPTVGKHEKNIETHIFDFDENLYGEEIMVEFYKFVRLERKFSGLEELQSQIAKDCLAAREIHKKMAADQK